MSFIAYLKQGIQVGDNSYNRFNSIYPQDRAIALRASHQYEGKVTSQETRDQLSERILDQAIEVFTVTDEVRAPKLDFWKRRSVQSFRLGISGLGLTVGGTGSAIAAYSLLAGTLAVAIPVAGGALAVTGVALAILGFYRSSQAEDQSQAWTDPLVAYQAHRQKALLVGFPHVLAHHLKGSLVHPEESLQLWREWSYREMSSYQQMPVESFPSSEVIGRIKKFFQNNPLAAEAMHYAFDGVASVPQNIQDLSRFYEQMKASYSNVRAEAAKARRKIEEERGQLIRQNEANRQAWLAPAQLVRESMKSEAHQQKWRAIQPFKNDLDRIITDINRRFSKGELDVQQKNNEMAKAQHNYHHHPIVRAAEQEYQAKCRKYELLYQLAAAPIHLKFDHDKRKIENWAENEIRKINEKENKEIGYFAKDVQGVAQAFVDRTNYNRMQEQMMQQEGLYPHLEPFTDWNTAYPRPAFNPELTEVELNQFYSQIYQQRLPSAPPL